MSSIDNIEDEKVKDLESPVAQELELTDAEKHAANKASRADVFAIIASGAALISDGYQNNLMTTGNLVFKKIWGSAYTSNLSTQVSNSLIIGEIIGMISIGLICDRIGRKSAILFTTMCIVLGSILATACSGSTAHGFFWFMIVSRGITGFGTGGEYPASSTSAVEGSNVKFGINRGRIFTLVTNLPLSLGGPMCLIIFLICLAASGYDNTTTPASLHSLNIVWRVEFSIGILLPLSVLYFRLKMLNSHLYQKNALKKNVPYMLVLKKYWRTLLGTAGTWFLYDFVTFPNGVFSAVIISSVIPNATTKSTAEWTLLLNMLSIPGLLIGSYILNWTGRRNLLIIGFSGYLVIGLIIGCAYDRITKIVPLFVIFYGLMQSFGNMGPGNMEGLISVESYPTALRGTCYGLSAAVGKAGAAIGTQAFTPIQNNLGKKWTFIIAAICGVLGILLAFFFVKDKTKDDLALEDEIWRQYLVDNNFDGELGDGSIGLQKAADAKDDVSLEFA